MNAVGTGKPLRLKLKLSEIQSLLQQVELSDKGSCWLWTGTATAKGYGQVGLRGTDHLAHRVFYRAFKGWLASGDDVHHRCRVKLCCNPAHLEKVDHYKHASGGYANPFEKEDDEPIPF